MPDEQGGLYAAEVAERAGITVSDWRARVSRGYAPKPYGYDSGGGKVRAVWDPLVVAEYLTERDRRKAVRAET